MKKIKSWAIIEVGSHHTNSICAIDYKSKVKEMLPVSISCIFNNEEDVKICKKYGTPSGHKIKIVPCVITYNLSTPLTSMK